MTKGIAVEPRIDTVFAYINHDEDNTQQMKPGDRFALKGHYLKKTAANIYQMNDIDLEHDLEEYGFCTVYHHKDVVHLVQAGTSKSDLQDLIDLYENGEEGFHVR
jgi:hypothetical protein